MIVLLCALQVGDGSNFVIMFAGRLLKEAEDLLRKGLHPSDIIKGYQKAATETLSILENYVIDSVEDVKDKDQLIKGLKPALASSHYGQEDVLAELIADACLRVMPEKASAFNVDNVRVSKVPGGGLSDSYVTNGMVINRAAEGTINKIDDAKIAIFNCPVDAATTEGKGKTVFNSAEEMKEYSVNEENAMEETIKAIAEAGVNVVISGSSFGEMALHFLEKYGIMAIKILSKFQLRRLGRTTGATIMVRLGAPTPEEIGECTRVHVQEVGSTKVCVFEQADEETSGVATVVIRGSTANGMDDVERAINTGVNVVKQMTKDGRMLAGAGAIEAELAQHITSMGKKTPGLDQYAIKKFATALLVFPTTLAENAGLKASEAVTTLSASHAEGNSSSGINVEQGAEDVIIDSVENGIFDMYATKHSAIRLAHDAASTVLQVDQIIMAKPAGGPKVPKPGHPDQA
eukprot:TRINITY_DN713_c0_g2_i3.p1 TRINITY_DN713_c0_g2~~TRINITY_DN713_c0_g2_i3.p1  ORF type:complete len:461 (+),score=191.60 TRINITY_DN713_c0_g2_i3:710-2092(+)